MTEDALPLSGIRVLDLGIITAGAATTAILADLGAEVIKIEAPTYLDPFRVWTGLERKDDWWNQSPYFAFTNRNKKSVCLDIKSDKGRALFVRLLKDADVLVENFRRGVMERLGLDAANLRRINPALVFAAVSSQGETGKDRMAVSFGSTLEATSGMAALAGSADGPPIITGRDLNYPDQVVALFAASMILSALHHRRRTGHGAHLDMSQRELTTYLVGDKFVGGGEPEREGNADGCSFLQIVEAAADDVWVALTLADESDAARLAEMGLADEVSLRRWIVGLPSGVVVKSLQDQGIAAAAVVDGNGVCASAWFHGSMALAKDPSGGHVKGFPFQFRQRKMRIERATPPLGGDTAAVLRNLLALDDEEIADLMREGIIGDRPALAVESGNG